MSKYLNKRITIAGIRFDSQAEADRYLVLRDMEEKGEIRNLRLQPQFTLLPAFTDSTGKRHAGITYKADFSYVGPRPGHPPDSLDIVHTVEDVKGFFTQSFRLKWKLLLNQFKDSRSVAFRLIDANTQGEIK